jgi:hypothetical protein
MRSVPKSADSIVKIWLHIILSIYQRGLLATTQSAAPNSACRPSRNLASIFFWRDISLLAHSGKGKWLKPLPFRETILNCFLRLDTGLPVRPDQFPHCRK